ncbi:hypothetical protein B0H63DRAFT_397196 [Podospora didyma]|uniref:3-keto-steroid reductase n=1 Tax=Podospora didyma TaxID=330526 RepID=A0AAE0NHE1_9PEZI|nr:hypothetical protein B0H63DRAFT_397196 [Podospora didyma]
MPPAPWESVPSHETYFALVTGANSGIGFGIGQRLIDEYLATRSLTSHIVVIPTTRSVKKSNETVYALRQHVKQLAETSTALRSRAGPSYELRDTTRRVHILSVQLDLCNLATVRRAAEQLVHGTLNSPPPPPQPQATTTSSSSSFDDDDDDFFEPLVDVRIPRLDVVIFNAGIGGWTGLDWYKVAHNILTRGLVQATTWPTFKAATGGYVVNPLPDAKDPLSVPKVGEVFCANLFGHYLFAHAIVPLLSRPSSTLAPGRIIWESSIEGTWADLSLDDFQGIRSREAYESAKRLTDVLALTAALPSTRPYTKSYLSSSSSDPTNNNNDNITPPKIYLVHPGVVQTTLFPLNAFMFFWYRIVLYIARFLGSPWHPITAYNGAVAPVWLALQEQAALDAAGAERVKWGSSTDRSGECRVKKTEVEGWGWDGTVDDSGASKEEKKDKKDKDNQMVGKLVGRRYGAVDLTEERRRDFETLGAVCWEKMEKLRAEWEKRIEDSLSG